MDRKKLKEFRKQAGLGQEEVAKRLNVSGALISQWESGKVHLTVDHLEELCQIYGVSPSALWEDSDGHIHVEGEGPVFEDALIALKSMGMRIVGYSRGGLQRIMLRRRNP